LAKLFPVWNFMSTLTAVVQKKNTANHQYQSHSILPRQGGFEKPMVESRKFYFT